MKVTETKLPGVLIIEPKVFGDSRGCFFETYHAERYAEFGIKAPFVQDNFSRSSYGVLRGLHYQLEHTQGKLVWITCGKIYDVVVDVRHDSPTFGQWVAVTIDANEPKQVYIPPGYAHGFCVLSEQVDFFYKCTDIYHPASEKGIRWNDPDLNIPWPIEDPVLSTKDMHYPNLKNIPVKELLSYGK